MPLIDVQRRGRELGRIRIGTTLVKNGKRLPAKLDAFRFTTRSRQAADAVAALLGGTVGDWEGQDGFLEVATAATSLPVAIPPGQPLTQWHEMWDGRGLRRRCDGAREQLTAGPCLCPPPGLDRAELAADGRACKPTSRLSLILPDLPDIGVWLLVTHGMNAAVELAGSADLLHRAAVADVLIPATLRLEQREATRRPDQPVRKFGVPVLELGVTFRELTSGAPMATLPPAPVRVLPAAPAPAALPAAPTGTSADAQRIAEHLTQAQTRSDVEALAEQATAAEVNSRPVTGPDGEPWPLRDLLAARWQDLA